MSFRTRGELYIEEVDDGYLVLEPGSGRVLRLRGSEAEAFALARCGTHTVSDRLATSMATLVELDLVETDTWSRRQILQFGGAAAAAGVVAVALPSVAAAASSPGSTTPEATAPSTTTPITFPPSTIPRGLYFTESSFGYHRNGDLAFTGPQNISGLTFDPVGNLYIASIHEQAVYRWNGTDVTKVFGGLPSAPPYDPRGMVFDAAGHLYIVSSFDGSVVRWDGHERTVLFSGLTLPIGAAIGADGHLYFTHQYGVVRWDGHQMTTAFSNGWPPYGLACTEAGTMYASFTSKGTVERCENATLTPVLTGLAGPTELTVDDAGNVYVAEYDSGAVSCWDGTTKSVVTAGWADLNGLAFF
jgi:DNA-binding beta-propeller fold protein YncE